MKQSIRKSGFTLIETLLAMVITLIVLVATVGMSRSMQTNAFLTEDASQMHTLADQSFQLFDMYRYSTAGLPANQRWPALVQFDASGVAKGMFIESSLNNANSIPTINVDWCTYTGTNTTCTQAVSPVCPSDVASPCKLSDIAVKHPGQDFLAIRRSTPPTTSAFNEVDISHQPSGSTTITTSDTSNWNFYTRTMQIQKVAALASKPVFTTSTDDGLVNNTYLLTVTITNYNNPRSSITRSKVITDWK